jgi:hypothetical protein
MFTLEYYMYTDITRYAEGLSINDIFSVRYVLFSSHHSANTALSSPLLLLSQERRRSGTILLPLTSVVSCTSALKIESPPPQKKTA